MRGGLIRIAVFLLLGIVAAEPAAAHSTKGRIRVPLKKAVLAIDDVAYFFESYVHRQLYKDRYEKSNRRFYVKKFVRIDQQGPQATVHFITLDIKENRDFPDTMQISRGVDTIWVYRPGGKDAPVPLYTYVKKWEHYYRTYFVPALGAGVLVLAGVLGWLLFFRRKQGRVVR